MKQTWIQVNLNTNNFAAASKFAEEYGDHATGRENRVSEAHVRYWRKQKDAL